MAGLRVPITSSITSFLREGSRRKHIDADATLPALLLGTGGRTKSFKQDPSSGKGCTGTQRHRCSPPDTGQLVRGQHWESTSGEPHYDLLILTSKPAPADWWHGLDFQTSPIRAGGGTREPSTWAFLAV